MVENQPRPWRNIDSIVRQKLLRFALLNDFDQTGFECNEDDPSFLLSNDFPTIADETVME